MSRKGPANPERSFGVSVGGVLLLIAAFLMWRGRIAGGQWSGGVGALLVGLGLLAPRLLKWPSALWWKLAMALGYVNARVILTIAFLLVLTPIAFVWRLIGRDPLGKRRESWPGWTAYPQRYADRSHFTRMY
ncbi:MAG TPA: SxtJ family membrane protein [Vicinamibacterales bacterium]|nr:SxtJ family membrane protein [Vicinamibacterales bacterium]